jgi:hypothetical protein
MFMAFYSAIYDRISSGAERAGLSEDRHRPGGRLVFLEHVRDTDPKMARRQDHPVFLYSWVGCHPNRDTLAAISRAPFEVTTVQHGEVPKAPRVERPMIMGTAVRCG